MTPAWADGHPSAAGIREGGWISGGQSRQPWRDAWLGDGQPARHCRLCRPSPLPIRGLGTQRAQSRGDPVRRRQTRSEYQTAQALLPACGRDRCPINCSRDPSRSEAAAAPLPNGRGSPLRRALQLAAGGGCVRKKHAATGRAS